MTPYRAPGPSPPKKTGPTALGSFIMIAFVLGVVATIALMVWELTHATSPESVQAELRGPKRDYVGSWSSANDKGNSRASFSLYASGDINYYEGNLTGESRIDAFEGNDIVLHNGLRIVVTSAPHQVGDHFEMTAKGTRAKPGSAWVPDGMTFQR